MLTANVQHQFDISSSDVENGCCSFMLKTDVKGVMLPARLARPTPLYSMPTRVLEASVEEVRKIIGADRLIFQDLDDLIDAVKDTKHSKVEGFDCAVFNGCYITGQINEAYLDHLQAQRNDTAKTGKKGVQIVADTPVDMMGIEEI